ncbi:hypothetical protein ACN9MJ_24920 [Acidovorax facilis]|uniref:hypothetical protein n=1 Tax=Acidovorax facilis TaxID=12917 RepID=UPI003CEA4174
MQVAPSASTYAPAPGDLASPPAPGGAGLFPDQPQDHAGAFADSGPGGYAQPDPQADPALASTSLFAPTDHTPSDTLALMVQAQTKPLLVTAENAADLGIDFAHTKPLLVTPENAAGLNLPPQTGSAAPANATASNASPTEIAALELLLAEPANQEIIAQYGPPLRPLNTDTNVGQGILARFGPDLGARLTQLQEAQDGVRNEYLRALDQARQSPGPQVPGSILIPASGQGETLEPERWTLDPAAFSRHYAQGDSLAQRAFADLHGQDPLVFHEGREGDAHSEPSYHTLGPFRLAQGQPYGSDPSLPDACLLRHYTQLTPQHSADLINKEYLWFDPVNGWSTSADNIQAPTGFLDKALPVAFSALMCMVALPPVGTLLSQAGAGTFVQGAAMGAMGSAISQTVMTGGIDFGNLLRSALTGGIAGSVMQYTGLKDMLDSADLAKSSLAHLGKAGLTGLLQEATGGKFKDGFMNSALASIAAEVGAQLDHQIGELKDISPEQASVLKLLSKAASSALRIAGTNDPAAGFAGEFLSGVLGDGLQGAQATGQGQDQSQEQDLGPNLGSKPSSDWVRNLGGSEVDAQTAQWVEAFANPAALPPSQGIQVASAPIGTVGDAGYFDDNGAYIEPAQLIWPDGTTSTLAQSSDGEPMLAETEVRETAPAVELLVNPETGLPDFKYTSSVVNAVNEGLDNALSGGTSTHAPAESPVMDTLQGLAYGAGKAAFELIAPVGDFLQVGNELGRSLITGEAPREINFISGIGQMAAQGATTADIINGGFVSLLTTPDRIGDAYERGDYRSMGEEFGGLGLNATLAGAGLRGSMHNVKVGAQLAVEDSAASGVGQRFGAAMEGYQYQTGALSYASEPGLNVPSSWLVGANGGVVPSGFANVNEFANFAGNVRGGLRSAGYPDVEPILQGSAVTGQSFRTGAPFDVGRVSDFDVALASPSLLQRAQELGIGVRSGGTRTGPLSARDLEALGLTKFAFEISAQAGREVNFMIYQSPAAAVQRAPSISLPGGK